MADLRVMETNRLNEEKFGRRKWRATTGDELMKFWGVACCVGLVTYLKIFDYWSKKRFTKMQVFHK